MNSTSADLGNLLIATGNLIKNLNFPRKEEGAMIHYIAEAMYGAGKHFAKSNSQISIAQKTNFINGINQMQNLLDNLKKQA